jgi:predicted  nucleic acid-binding Zn-ribbon protein
MKAVVSRLTLAILLASASLHAAADNGVKDKIAEKWSNLGPCAKGAIAGGVAGQVLGKHAVLGALAGCGTAKVVSDKKEAEARAAREAQAAKDAQAREAQAVKDAQAAKEAQAAAEARAAQTAKEAANAESVQPAPISPASDGSESGSKKDQPATAEKS